MALRERNADGGDSNTVLPVNTDSTIDSDEVAAIRRQRLGEISSWFGPFSLNNNSSSVAAYQVTPEQPLGVVNFDILPMENHATKCAVEGLARSGLHILLGGLCALTIVIFSRFVVVLTRIRYGPARYWAILFILWFLVFGIWASRSNASHNNP